MTESDAKEKWCPMMRMTVDYGSGKFSPPCNVGALPNGETQILNCLASKCMMWRWISHDEGYCGLAGKP